MIRPLIVGMPSSGKSTFIAALRYCLVSGEVDTALEIAKVSANETHLNKLEEKWIACEEVERTRGVTNTWVTLHVRDKATGQEAEVVLPDLSGEAYREPAAAGRCRRSLYEAVSDANGIALFTSAERSQDDLMITDVADLYEELGEGDAKTVQTGGDWNAAEAAAGDENVAEKQDEADIAAEAIAREGQSKAEAPTPFDPEAMPEETNVVEFLQFMNRKPLVARKRRIAVIVSAWDVAEATGLSPGEWLDVNRPMLAQFLVGNSDLWEVRVFGVSAQGGVLPRDRAMLRGKRPAEKAEIVGADALPHDISAPIRWIMT
jgi:hypothetical protein